MWKFEAESQGSTPHQRREALFEQRQRNGIEPNLVQPLPLTRAVANRLRRRTSDQTVLGSNPAVAAALSPWTIARLFTPFVPRRRIHISFR